MQKENKQFRLQIKTIK